MRKWEKVHTLTSTLQAEHGTPMSPARARSSQGVRLSGGETRDSRRPWGPETFSLGGVNLCLPKIMKMHENARFLKKNHIFCKKWGPETFED